MPGAARATGATPATGKGDETAPSCARRAAAGAAPATGPATAAATAGRRAAAALIRAIIQSLSFIYLEAEWKS